MLYLENVKVQIIRINAHLSAHIYTKVHNLTQLYTKIGEIMSSKFVEIHKVCQWCGSVFIAKKQNTRYCTHTCNSRAYKANKRIQTKTRIEKTTDEIIKNQPIADFKDRDFLNCTQAAKLLGVCRKTVYNLIYNKKLRAVRITSRITIIRRKDIDELLEISIPYEPQQKTVPKPITDFYTLENITSKYGLKTRRIWDIIKEKNIPTQKQGKKTYISQKHIDNYFKKNPPRKKISHECNA